MARRGRPRLAVQEVERESPISVVANAESVLPSPSPVSESDTQFALTRILGVPVADVEDIRPAEMEAIRTKLTAAPLVQVLDTAPASFRMRVALASHRRSDNHAAAAALDAALHRLDELRNALPAAIEAAGPEHAPALRDLLTIL